MTFRCHPMRHKLENSDSWIAMAKRSSQLINDITLLVHPSPLKIHLSSNLPGKSPFADAVWHCPPWFCFALFTLSGYIVYCTSVSVPVVCGIPKQRQSLSLCQCWWQMLQINRQEEIRGVPGIITGHESFKVIIGGNSQFDSQIPLAYSLLVKTTA